MNEQNSTLPFTKEPGFDYIVTEADRQAFAPLRIDDEIYLIGGDWCATWNAPSFGFSKTIIYRRRKANEQTGAGSAPDLSGMIAIGAERQGICQGSIEKPKPMFAGNTRALVDKITQLNSELTQLRTLATAQSKALEKAEKALKSTNILAADVQTLNIKNLCFCRPDYTCLVHTLIGKAVFAQASIKDALTLIAAAKEAVK